MQTPEIHSPPSPESAAHPGLASSGSTHDPDGAEAVLQRAARTARANAARAESKRPRSLAELVADAMPKSVASPEELARLDAIDRRMEVARRVELWRISGVPKKYREVPRSPDLSKLPQTLADADGPRPVREPYRAVMARLLTLEGVVGGSLVAMLGDRGPGKTWMACCLIKRFCAAGRMALYAEALDYFVALRSTYGDRGTGTEIDVEAKYLRPEFLVLDAVEEKGESPSQQQMLTRLLNKRIMDNKITLIISNDDGGSLPDRIGRSLYDRLNDGGGVISCEWPSLRGHV